MYMKIAGIIIIIVGGCVTLLFALVSWDGSPGLTPEIIKDSKHGLNNGAVHMVGCRVLPEAVAPKVILPPVVKTYVSLPCATEVPPPLAAIEHEKIRESR